MPKEMLRYTSFIIEIPAFISSLPLRQPGLTFDAHAQSFKQSTGIFLNHGASGRGTADIGSSVMQG